MLLNIYYKSDKLSNEKAVDKNDLLTNSINQNDTSTIKQSNVLPVGLPDSPSNSTNQTTDSPNQNNVIRYLKQRRTLPKGNRFDVKYITIPYIYKTFIDKYTNNYISYLMIVMGKSNSK